MVLVLSSLGNDASKGQTRAFVVSGTNKDRLAVAVVVDVLLEIVDDVIVLCGAMNWMSN